MPQQVLVVDDETAVASMLKSILETHGHSVVTAGSAAEARQALAADGFDVVLTDMRMENDDAGYEVVRAAKARPRPPAVVILTAFPMLAQQWREAGADAVLPKPTSMNQLLEVVEKFGPREEPGPAGNGM
jgi:CheY-like chemotaxis protein